MPGACQLGAGSAIKRPCEPVPVTHAPEGHRPDAKRRVHRSAARLPARPRPAPLMATNSSPGVCSVPTPPSHCISPPVCWRSITPPVAVAGSWGRNARRFVRDATSSAPQGERPRTPANAPFRSSIAAFTFPSHNCPSSSFSNVLWRSLGPPAELIDSEHRFRRCHQHKIIAWREIPRLSNQARIDAAPSPRTSNRSRC